MARVSSSLAQQSVTNTPTVGHGKGRCPNPPAEVEAGSGGFDNGGFDNGGFDTAGGNDAAAAGWASVPAETTVGGGDGGW